MAAFKSLSTVYVKDQPCLFLGNGINQLSHGFSWTDLLNNIQEKAGVVTQLGQKTYPLFFDELSFTLDPDLPVERNIHLLKKMIASDALKLKPNTVHQKLIHKAHYAHFLTTNYDYCVERTIDSSVSVPAHQDKRTAKYSLYRYHDMAGRQVWHIHGECDNGRKSDPADSILIGFEHYADYLDKIHRLLKSDTGKGLGELISESRDNWVHKFFTHDMDILGFGLDFNETHLWFILNFRARMIRKKVSIINQLRWIIPSFEKDKCRDKIDLLTALQVKVVLIPANTYPEFYEVFLNNL